jgi:hypothetical protein
MVSEKPEQEGHEEHEGHEELQLQVIERLPGSRSARDL